MKSCWRPAPSIATFTPARSPRRQMATRSCEKCPSWWRPEPTEMATVGAWAMAAAQAAATAMAWAVAAATAAIADRRCPNDRWHERGRRRPYEQLGRRRRWRRRGRRLAQGYGRRGGRQVQPE